MALAIFSVAGFEALRHSAESGDDEGRADIPVLP
jgi:hypothetical protein